MKRSIDALENLPACWIRASLPERNDSNTTREFPRALNRSSEPERRQWTARFRSRDSQTSRENRPIVSTAREEPRREAAPESIECNGVERRSILYCRFDFVEHGMDLIVTHLIHCVGTRLLQFVVRHHIGQLWRNISAMFVILILFNENQKDRSNERREPTCR